MNTHEAIEWLEKDIKLHEVFNETKHQNKAIEALNMAIDALTKEPEEDCISREWVMDLYEEWKPMLATNVDGFGYALKCAPSVVPKRGKWIGIDDYPHEDWECNNCGYVIEAFENPNDFRYCPNCGADMRGDEE